MSGLALSALIIFSLLIPGIVFQYKYYRSAAAGWSTAGTINTNSVRALLLAILFCLPIHAIWGFLISLIDSYIVDIGQIDYFELLSLLQGTALEKDSDILDQLNAWLPSEITLYVWSQVIAAAYLGDKSANTAARFGWNKSIALSTQGAFWHKVLGYPDSKPDGIIVSMTVTLDDTTYLYYGLLFEYQLTEGGDLHRIVLQAAVRRKMNDPSRESLYEIPGEYFVVNCRNVDTVDIDYFWLENGVEENSEANS